MITLPFSFVPLTVFFLDITYYLCVKVLKIIYDQNTINRMIYTDITFIDTYLNKSLTCTNNDTDTFGKEHNERYDIYESYYKQNKLHTIKRNSPPHGRSLINNNFTL